MARVREFIKQYASYWGEVVKMWWRNNFKNWIISVMAIFGAVVLVTPRFDVDLSPYAFDVFLITVILAVMPVLIWIPYRLWNQAAPFIVREQRANPTKYTFPYLDSINASSIKQGETRLDLTIFVPSGLLFDLELVKVRGTVIVDGTPSDEVELNPTTIRKQTISTILFSAHLSRESCNKILESFNQQRPVEIHVLLNVWGKDNTRYPLDVANKTYTLN